MASKLSDLASLAEIVAAFGVIVSLLFVGFQIADGNRETRSATVQAVLDSEIYVQSQLLRYPNTWDKIASGQPLSDRAEERRGILLFTMLMTVYDNRYHQVKSGLMEQSLTGIPLAFPFYEVWRESGGATSRSTEFLDYVDRERKKRLAQQ